MSRPSDVERGARIALDISAQRLRQPDLFSDAIPTHYWGTIYDRASETLGECEWSRSVLVK